MSTDSVTNLKIRRAQPSDLDDMLKICEIARQIMKDNGNPHQWGDTWPPRTLIENYTRENGYVVTNNGRIVALFGFFPNADDESYRKIDGAWLNDYPYTALHTLASDGSTRGVTRAVFDFAFSRCTNIRVDTHECNTAVRHILDKYGFTYCGKIKTPTRDNTDCERLAFQKCIDR